MKYPSPRDALALLDDAVSKAALTRNDHQKVHLCVEVLENTIRQNEMLQAGDIPPGMPASLAALAAASTGPGGGKPPGHEVGKPVPRPQRPRRPTNGPEGETPDKLLMEEKGDESGR